jgi:hypothetical protein
MLKTSNFKSLPWSIHEPHLQFSKVDISSFIGDPSSPCFIVCRLQVRHPSPGIEQSARPSTVIEQLPKLTKSPNAFATTRRMNSIRKAASESYCELLIFVIVLRDQFCCGPAAFLTSWKGSFEDRGCHPGAHLILIPRERQERGT